MSYNPQNPNGQATSANSLPVVIASDQSTVAVSAASLPLPAGAATSTDQTNGSQKTQVVDGSGNIIGSTSNALNVNIINSSVSESSNLTQIDGTSIVTGGVPGTLAVGGNQAAGGTITSNTDPILIGGSDYSSTAKLQTLKIDSSGNAQVAVTNSVSVSGTITTTPPANASTNIAQVGGSTVATASTGVQKVGVTDGTGNAITSTSSALDVNIKSGGSSSASSTDETAWAAGSSTFAPTGGVYNDSATALMSGQQGTHRLTNNRALHSNLRNSGGTEIATASNPIRIDPTGTTIQPISGIVTANAGTNLNTSALALESGGNLATLAGAVSGAKVNVNISSSSLSAQTTNVTQIGGNAVTTVANGTQAVGLTDSSGNDVNVVTGDSTGLRIANTSQTIPFTTSATGAQTLLANTDCRGYSWMEVVTTSIGTGLAWNGQFSPISGGTYIATSSWMNAGTSTASVSSLGTISNNIYQSPIMSNFFQVGITAMTGGTTSGYVVLHALPRQYSSIGAIIGNGSTNQNGTITSAGSSVTWSGQQNFTGAAIPISIHGTYAGVSFTVMASDDNATTYYNVAIYDVNNMQWRQPGATITPGTNASSLYWVTPPVNITGTFIKIQATAWTSGTATIRIGGSSGPANPQANMSQIMDSAGNARGANVNAGSYLTTQDASSSATGSAVPSTAMMVGLNNGTNLTAVSSAGSDALSGNSYLAVSNTLYNGASWDRIRTANSASGTTGIGLLGAAAMGIYNSSAPTASNGDYYALQLDSNANLKVNVAAGSGFTVQPGNTPNTTPWLVSLNPSTTGGWSVSSQTTLTNTVVSIKAAAGQFGGYMFNNPNAAVMYIQIFNIASGSVTLGTTTPTYVVPIPAGASANVEFANGIAHATAISTAVTTTATGSTAPTTALTGFFLYK